MRAKATIISGVRVNDAGHFRTLDAVMTSIRATTDLATGAPLRVVDFQ